MTRTSGDHGAAVRARWAGAIALTLVASLAAYDLAREWTVSEAQAMLDSGDVAVPELPLVGSPRERIANGLRLARHAANAPRGLARTRDLAAAAAAIEQATRARPIWGDALASYAYVYSIGDGRNDREIAIQALTRSYGAAPLLVGAGPWRVSYAASRWNDLSALTREAVLTEAVWLSGVVPATGDAILKAFRDSPGYVPLMRHWRRGEMPPGPEL